ncbi:MAG TPA: condensation domain-containing protein, partial [Pyrinomonadaceae bacterium]|nr:condensation domain-containing protein [Pyrinomonadaceae bacterium]
MQNQIQGFHLSPQQRRLRPVRQNNPAFRAQLALRLEGALDAAALRRSLESIVSRHEILRTTFQEEDGVTVQAVADDGAAAWETFDLSGVEPGERAAEVERRFAEGLRVPFDLASGPVVRASLLRLDDAEHVLLLALPALCADSRTLQNLTAELARAYAAARRGEGATGEATQYVDFAEWQNGLLGDDDARAGQKFWREKCAEGFPPLALPLERTPPAGAPFRPDALSLEIDSRFVSALDALARERGLSPESFLLACWQVLLWRLTGQRSVAVGYACDGRRYEDLRDALGLFARWLPVVCPLDGGRRFAEVWQRAEDESREASDWQEYFTWEAAGVADGAPLPLAACFRYEERAAAVESDGLRFSALKQYDCAEEFKVNLSCVRRGEALTAELQFRPDVLDRPDAERLARRFHTLLQNAFDAPDAPLRQLSVLPPEEREELLHAFDSPHGAAGISDAHSLRDDSSRNDEARALSLSSSPSSAAASPEAVTLHGLFERQAERTPDAPAASFEGHTLTYRELDERADRLARRLAALGVV